MSGMLKQRRELVPLLERFPTDPLLGLLEAICSI